MSGYGKNSYREYRGRRPGGGSLALKTLVVILAVLLAAALIFSLFAGRYVEYTDEGVRLNFPWMQTAEPSAPAPSAPLVVETLAPEQIPSEQPAVVLGAVEVTAAQLAEGTAAEAVKQAGGNCLVVEMKNEYGRLNWVSGQELAAGRISSIADEVEESVRELAAQGELYLVARVNCFRDQALASAGVGGPLMTRGGNVWYDANGLRWVSAASPQAQDYLIALCLELAELGFDEVLLESAGFPCYGEVHVLATSDLRPENLSGPVEAFFQLLNHRLAEVNVKLSLLATEEMILSTDAYSGIHAGMLARFAQRVWAEAPTAPETDYEALLSQAGMDQPEQRLVIIGAPVGGGSWAAMEGPAG